MCIIIIIISYLYIIIINNNILLPFHVTCDTQGTGPVSPLYTSSIPSTCSFPPSIKKKSHHQHKNSCLFLVHHKRATIYIIIYFIQIKLWQETEKKSSIAHAWSTNVCNRSVAVFGKVWTTPIGASINTFGRDIFCRQAR